MKSAIVKLLPADSACSLSQSALVRKPYLTPAGDDAARIGALIVICSATFLVTFKSVKVESALVNTLLNNVLKAVNGKVLLETVPVASITTTSISAGFATSTTLG